MDQRGSERESIPYRIGKHRHNRTNRRWGGRKYFSPPTRPPGNVLSRSFMVVKAGWGGVDFLKNPLCPFPPEKKIKIKCQSTSRDELHPPRKAKRKNRAYQAPTAPARGEKHDNLLSNQGVSRKPLRQDNWGKAKPAPRKHIFIQRCGLTSYIFYYYSPLNRNSPE